MTTMPMFLGPWTGTMYHTMPSYSLEDFGKLVGSNQATSFQGAPSVVLQLANSDITSRYDFLQAQMINVGGAPLEQDLVDRLFSKAPWKLVPAYGMTEAAGYIAYQQFHESLDEAAIGKLLPNINSHPTVAEGGDGAAWGESQLTELATAWVGLRSHITGNAAILESLREVHRSVDGQVSGYKKLTGGVWNVSALPKNATGNIFQKAMATMRDGLCSLDTILKPML